MRAAPAALHRRLNPFEIAAMGLFRLLLPLLGLALMLPLSPARAAAEPNSAANTGIAGPARIEPAVPRYKPSSRAPRPMDITTNAYGYSRNAPDALGIGDRAPDFQLPAAAGGNHPGGAVELARLRQQGPVVLIFYRGHW